MKKSYMTAVAIVVIVMGAGCRSHEKRSSRYDTIDGGYVARKECYRPVDDCWSDCEKRNASRTCVGCCRDQEFLCDTDQPHSFESCKGVR